MLGLLFETLENFWKLFFLSAPSQFHYHFKIVCDCIKILNNCLYISKKRTLGRYDSNLIAVICNLILAIPIKFPKFHFLLFSIESVAKSFTFVLCHFSPESLVRTEDTIFCFHLVSTFHLDYCHSLLTGIPTPVYMSVSTCLLKLSTILFLLNFPIFFLMMKLRFREVLEAEHSHTYWT